MDFGLICLLQIIFIIGNNEDGKRGNNVLNPLISPTTEGGLYPPSFVNVL